MAIRLVIDSASDISVEEAKEYGWVLLPLTVTFGDTQYKDGVDITPDRFYDMLIESDELPHTSQLTPSDYEDAFEKIIAEGDTPFVIAISSKLSGTYQSACIAAEACDPKPIVVDSLSAALGEAVLIRYADSLIRDGMGVEELEKTLNEVKHKIRILALLDTLEYLRKGGRISAAVEFAGSLLQIKPVIGVEEGEVVMVGKARGSKKGNNLLNELINKGNGVDFSMPYTLAYTGNDMGYLNKYVEDSRSLWENDTESLPVMRIGATIGTHIGPGAIGVVFFEK
ncbi:MAG: DegV family protein [Oscillospiraceae bacterium]|nr:DegV family protein [Oscillospiraceae bacterium]